MFTFLQPSNYQPTHISLLLLAIMLLNGCGSSPKREHNDLRPQLTAAALAMQGKPYRYGGTSPTGFDCSGLVHYSFKKIGLTVPRTSYEQYKSSANVYRRGLQAGDLVFFRTNGRFVSHVGIYIGKNQFVHAPGKGKRVKIDRLDARYWQKHFVGGGSLLH